jgi:adenylate cyclase
VDAADLASALLALGQDRYRRYTPGDNAVARVLLKAAIVLDPTSARAHALLAATYRQDATLLWTADPARAEARALDLAEHAVALARQELDPQPSLPSALEQRGFVRLYRYDYDGCIQDAQEAYAHPSSSNQAKARAHALWAHALVYQGDPTEALRTHLPTDEEELKNPPPFTIRYNKGHALAVLAYYTEQGGDPAAQQIYAAAEAELRQVLADAPTYRPARTCLAVVLWAQGKRNEARAEMRHLADEGRMSPHDPDFAAYIRRAHPFTDKAYLAHLIVVWQAAA